MGKFIAGLMAMVLVVAMTFVAWASDEATDVHMTPVVVESLNFQYGDESFGWQRIRTEEFQFDFSPDGDIRLGVRGDLCNGVHARLLAKLHGTDLTEIRPELVLSDDDWYSFISVGIDTRNGETSLYDETVWDFATEDNWRFGVALVHTGGLSGQPSTVNLGPHLNVQLAQNLNLDLHYGWRQTDNTPNEAWAIVGFKVQ